MGSAASSSRPRPMIARIPPRMPSAGRPSRTPRCSGRRPLRSCPLNIRRAEIFTSTAADNSPNRTVDVNGHALGVSGMVIIERAEASNFFGDFGVTTTWDVGGEEVLDNSGWRAWEALYPDASPNAKWLPISSYRFEAASPQAAVPEASTWALLDVGFRGACRGSHRAAPSRLMFRPGGSVSVRKSRAPENSARLTSWAETFT